MTEAGAGLASAAASAMADAPEMFDPDPMQIELQLADGPRDATAIAAAIDKVRRGPGRPAGSPNKRTAKIRDALLTQYPHPLQFLMATQATPEDVLAVRLGCSKAEAHGYRQRAAIEALPYLEGKMPVTLNLGGEGHMTLVLGSAMAAPGAPIGGHGAAITVPPAISFAHEESAQNQGLGEGQRDVSE